MNLVSTKAYEIAVPDHFEELTGEARYELQWREIMTIYAKRAGMPDKFKLDRRKQARK